MNKNELIDPEVKKWIDNDWYWKQPNGEWQFRKILINTYSYYKMTANQVLAHFDYILETKQFDIEKYKNILQMFYSQMYKPSNQKQYQEMLNGELTEKEKFANQIKTKSYYKSLLDYTKQHGRHSYKSLFNNIWWEYQKNGDQIAYFAKPTPVQPILQKEQENQPEQSQCNIININQQQNKETSNKKQDIENKSTKKIFSLVEKGEENKNTITFLNKKTKSPDTNYDKKKTQSTFQLLSTPTNKITTKKVKIKVVYKEPIRSDSIEEKAQKNLNHISKDNKHTFG